MSVIRSQTRDLRNYRCNNMIAKTGPIRLFLSTLVCLMAIGAPGRAEFRDPEFIRNNVLHVLYHEFGHALIDQFDLPVLGQEEDAADTFATLKVIELEGEDAVEILRDVIEGWLVLHSWSERSDQLDFYGEHDLDAQRGFRVACQLYGIHPVRYRKVAEWVDLPKWRQESCGDDVNLARRSWNTVLRPKRLPVTAQAMKFKLVYEDAGEFRQERKFLEENRILEDTIEIFTESYRWPRPLKVTALRCGHSNAYWDPADLEIEFCYEFVHELAELDVARKTVGWKSTRKRRQPD